MKLTKLAVLLSGAALSATVLAADPIFSGTQPRYNVDETKAATQTAARFADENDTSWMTPKSKPAFSGTAAASSDHMGLPNDIDEQAIALGTATHGTTTKFAGKAGAVGSE